MEDVLNNELYIKKILSFSSLNELKICSLLNSKWNKEAVERLHEISTTHLNLDYSNNHARLRAYLRMVECAGGRIVTQHPNLSARLKFEPRSREEQDDTILFLVDAFLKFGQNVRTLLISVDFNKGLPTRAQYMELFSTLQNIERLRVSLQNETCLQISSYYPFYWNLPSLKEFWFEFSGQIEGSEVLSRVIVNPLISSAKQLTTLICERYDVMRPILREVKKLGRLGQIEEIVTGSPPPGVELTDSILLNVPHLSHIELIIRTSKDVSSTNVILTEYADRLTSLCLTLEGSSNDENVLIFPSMQKLRILGIKLRTPTLLQLPLTIKAWTGSLPKLQIFKLYANNRQICHDFCSKIFSSLGAETEYQLCQVAKVIFSLEDANEENEIDTEFINQMQNYFPNAQIITGSKNP